MAVAENAILIDIRTPQEVSEGYIKNAKNIDYYNDSFMDKINELDKNQPIYLYCRSGGRSGKALIMLKDEGFMEVYNLLGGFNGWKSSGNDILVPPQ
ncbi:MAG: rhodanese-like domain-containing protein [Bacteroidia bacterium]|nr:rhodanese-like domain-containing protein [Bacteroidia bacterium]